MYTSNSDDGLYRDLTEEESRIFSIEHPLYQKVLLHLLIIARIAAYYLLEPKYFVKDLGFSSGKHIGRKELIVNARKMYVCYYYYIFTYLSAENSVGHEKLFLEFSRVTSSVDFIRNMNKGILSLIKTGSLTDEELGEKVALSIDYYLFDPYRRWPNFF